MPVVLSIVADLYRNFGNVHSSLLSYLLSSPMVDIDVADGETFKTLITNVNFAKRAESRAQFHTSFSTCRCFTLGLFSTVVIVVIVITVTFTTLTEQVNARASHAHSAAHFSLTIPTTTAATTSTPS
jgi:hypothetical protein